MLSLHKVKPNPFPRKPQDAGSHASFGALAMGYCHWFCTSFSPGAPWKQGPCFLHLWVSVSNSALGKQSMSHKCFIDLKNPVIRRMGPFKILFLFYLRDIEIEFCVDIFLLADQKYLNHTESCSNWIHTVQAHPFLSSQEVFCREISLSHIPLCCFNYLELGLNFCLSRSDIPRGELKLSCWAMFHSAHPTIRKNRFLLLAQVSTLRRGRSSTPQPRATHMQILSVWEK